jgi:hypothetical protein
MQPLKKARQVDPVKIVRSNPLVQRVNILGFPMTIKE